MSNFTQKGLACGIVLLFTCACVCNGASSACTMKHHQRVQIRNCTPAVDNESGLIMSLLFKIVC